MSKKHLRRICDSFSLVEQRSCAREQADAFSGWISQFAVPVESVPTLPESAEGSYCTEGIDIFFTFLIDGDVAYGRPYLPNATDSRLPHDKSSGYRIPIAELRHAPKVKLKSGHTDEEGFVIG